MAVVWCAFGVVLGVLIHAWSLGNEALTTNATVLDAANRVADSVESLNERLDSLTVTAEGGAATIFVHPPETDAELRDQRIRDILHSRGELE